MNKRLLHLLVCLFLAIAVFSVYSYVGNCDFIGFDDDLYVSENQYVRQGLTFESIKWAFTASHASTWQPIVWLSYMIESHIQGHQISPGLFHWTNLILHVLNAGLLLYLLYLMTGSFWPSVFVSAVLALQPVHVESVVWVAERKDVLSTLFCMLSLIFYVRDTHAPSRSRYILFTAVFVLGLMAKPMLITIPLIMLLLDYWPLERGDRGLPDLLLEKAPLLLPAFISGIITVMVQKSGGSVVSLEDVSLLTRILNVPVFYSMYILKLFWPANLAVLYLHPGAPQLHEILLGLLFMVSVTVLAVRYAKSHPFFLVGWLWYLVTMLPVIGLISFGLHGIADRFLYIPAIGIYVMVAWGVARVVGTKKNAALFSFVCGLSIAVIALLGWMTNRQVKLWESNVTLFTHTINVTEDNWAMRNCLGAARDRAGDLDGALSEFRAAAEINPRRPRIFYNIGCTLQKKGSIDDAIEAYKHALQISDDFLKARYNLGVAYEHQGRFNEALKEYATVLESEPEHLMAYNNMGTVYTKQGRLDLALKCYHDVLAIEPDYIKARYNLGAILFQLGRYKEAASQFSEILQKQPDNGAVRKHLILSMNKAGEPGVRGNRR
jgi:Flp pilus assembly protein TadD